MPQSLVLYGLPIFFLFLYDNTGFYFRLLILLVLKLEIISSLSIGVNLMYFIFLLSVAQFPFWWCPFSSSPVYSCFTSGENSTEPKNYQEVSAFCKNVRKWKKEQLLLRFIMNMNEMRIKLIRNLKNQIGRLESKCLIQNHHFSNIYAYGKKSFSLDSFTNLEFQIYKFFNECLYSTANRKKAVWDQ